MRISGSVLLIFLAASALAQETGVSQVPAASDETSVQIAPARVDPADPLTIDQPSADAIDACDSDLIGATGTDCNSVALPAEETAASPAYPVAITSDGVFLQLEPQTDTVYEPDEIVRRLDRAATTPAPDDWGVNAVAAEPTEAPNILNEIPPLPPLNADPGAYDFSLE